MAGQAIELLFNQMYDETSQKVLIYITSKCGNPSDIQDIFQETYTELFFILKKRGGEYVQNSEAFAMQIAKQKVYRHYTLLQKLKNGLPIERENRGASRSRRPCKRRNPPLTTAWSPTRFSLKYASICAANLPLPKKYFIFSIIWSKQSRRSRRNCR